MLTINCQSLGPIFIKLQFWKLLSNSKATFSSENLNLISKPSADPQNGVAIHMLYITICTKPLSIFTWYATLLIQSTIIPSIHLPPP